MSPSDEILLTTPLDALHRELGGKMVPFAGYAMPVQYPQGILGEHLATRTGAGLFDVSHMGQVTIEADDPARLLERLVPGDISGLAPGRTRYSVFTNEAGGILDDLMISKLSDRKLYLVVNAACKHLDFAHLQDKLGSSADIRLSEDRALLALQGPKAAAVMAGLCDGADQQPFMSIRDTQVAGIAALVTRSGYTGEDGYEISVPAEKSDKLARLILGLADVSPVGLGARDSLRLEAGLCLYGADIDTTTSPVEAGLTWIISKRRRSEGGFPGADRILTELAQGPKRLRVGIRPLGRAPARAHTQITDLDGTPVGEVTSGGFGPSLDAPVAMGYVPTALAQPGTKLHLMVRGKPLDGEITSMPFVAHRYFKG